MSGFIYIVRTNAARPLTRSVRSKSTNHDLCGKSSTRGSYCIDGSSRRNKHVTKLVDAIARSFPKRSYRTIIFHIHRKRIRLQRSRPTRDYPFIAHTSDSPTMVVIVTHVEV